MPNWKDDKAIIVLGFFTVFFAGITLGIVWLRPTDGQTYQTFVSLLSGFAGAVLLHLNPQNQKKIEEGKDGDSTTVSK